MQTFIFIEIDPGDWRNVRFLITSKKNVSNSLYDFIGYNFIEAYLSL